MKKQVYLITFICILCFFVSYISANAQNFYEKGNMYLSAEAAVLYDINTGRILYGKNADTPMAMASTTKIMSVLVALENADPYSTVRIDAESCGIEGSSIYLKEGEEFKLIDLLYAMMLASANDASVAVARSVGGSVESFADMMNKKAEELGLKDTHFTNPHGLDDSEHYTTATELALIAKEALKNPVFKQISSTKTKEIVNSAGDKRLLVNHNKLLRQIEGAIGVKTGYTKKCGRTLVGACEREGRILIAVTLNAPSDWSDHKKLFDYGFSVLENDFE